MHFRKSASRSFLAIGDIMDNSILWDRLAGALMLYVENYFLSKASYSNDSRFKLQPSYEVDYEISEDIIAGLQQSVEIGNIDEIWQHKICVCDNINNLPDYLQKLVIQFLPKFFSQYPQYQNADCLKLVIS